MRLRILHKGLILLLIPLVLQGFLLFQLYSSFREVDRLSRAEERWSTAIDVMDEIFTTLTKAAKYAWRTVGPTSEPLLTPEAFRTRMETLIAQEKELVGDNPAMSEMLLLLGPVTEDACELLKLAHQSGYQSSDISKWMALGPTARALGQKQVAIERVKHKGVEALGRKREETRAYRARIETQIFVSAIAEIALTLALLFYFLQDVTRRLKVLMGNAASIPTGEPLTMRVVGGDELAYLDDVLHGASVELERAAQHRKAITEMVSHDLRSPLLAANISLELLLSPDALDSREDHDKRVQGIKRNLTRLTSFVEDLLTIDQLESGRLKLSLEAVELRSLAEEAIDNLAVLSQEKNVTIRNELTGSEVVADKNRLLQVLLNLISNAIKFSPAGGLVLVYAAATQKNVTVSVKDEGPGIPEAERARLFEKFHQINSPSLPKGFGLGLFICKLIVERHGGQLGVESKLGHGSRFWFSLPVDESEGL